MNRTQATVTLLLASAVLLAALSGASAQALTARLDPSGMIVISQGEAQLAMVELNAHGPAWTHAPQSTSTAQTTDLPGGGGKHLLGVLPIPNTTGGLIRFTENVKAVPQGLRLEYDLSVPVAVKLNGLQLSVCLQTERYAEKSLTIAQPDGDPYTVTLPLEKGGQVWAGEGARIEIAKGTPEEIVIELRAAADAMVQDLRPWDHPVFEVRFPAIMEDAGREVTPDDRFHLEVSVKFGAPVTLIGP